MIIEEKDFRLIPISDDSPIFDLELLYTIRPKGKEPRQEFKNAAYGINLESAIKKIVQYKVASKHKDEAITLSTYLSEFKQELDTIRKLCGN